MKYFFVLAYTCHVVFVAAQQNITLLHPLKVGEKIPDLSFRHIINYSSPSAKLSDFKGKLIILDMWSTYCRSCIEAFPKMQAIQDKYKDKIQVLLADTHPAVDEPDDKVRYVLNRVKENTGLSLTIPMPLHDTLLNNLFPHQSESHVVLIDSTGTIKGITYAWGITEENIQALLDGKNIHIPVKNDWGYDSDSPLFINGNGGDESDFTYRSVITPFKDGLGSIIGNDVDSNGLVKRFYVVNYTLLSLFRIAYDTVFAYPPNRIFIETGDSAKFKEYNNEQEDNKNSYCYEIDAPATSKPAMLKYMQDDLYRSFHAIARNEERMMTCYLLKANNDVNMLIGTNDSADSDLEKNSLHKFVHNRPLTFLTDLLNNTFPTPVLDETGLSDNISIDFPFDIYNYNIRQWHDFLATIGLDLIEDKRKLMVTVISDKTN